MNIRTPYLIIYSLCVTQVHSLVKILTIMIYNSNVLKVHVDIDYQPSSYVNSLFYIMYMFIYVYLKVKTVKKMLDHFRLLFFLYINVNVIKEL